MRRPADLEMILIDRVPGRSCVAGAAFGEGLVALLTPRPRFLLCEK